MDVRMTDGCEWCGDWYSPVAGHGVGCLGACWSCGRRATLLVLGVGRGAVRTPSCPLSDCVTAAAAQSTAAAGLDADAAHTVEVKVSAGAVRLLNDWGEAFAHPSIEGLPHRGAVILSLTVAEAEDLHAAAGAVRLAQGAPDAEVIRIRRSMATVQENVAAALEALPAVAASTS